MNWTLWQIAIGIRAVYRVGVNLTAHCYEPPHSKKLWGYPYVKYPIRNTYQSDPMADSHSYQSSTWSWREPYDTQLRSTPQRNGMYPIANTYELDPMADGHSYQSSVWSWSEPYGTQLRSTPQQKAMGLSDFVCRVPHTKHLWIGPYGR